MTLTLANVAAYSIQLAVLVTVALVATRVLRLRAPRPSLRFWQAAFAVAILLPLFQPRTSVTGQMIESSAHFVSNSAPVAALATRGVDLAQWILLAALAGIVVRLLWLGARLHPPARHRSPTRPRIPRWTRLPANWPPRSARAPP